MVHRWNTTCPAAPHPLIRSASRGARALLRCVQYSRVRAARRAGAPGERAPGARAAAARAHLLRGARGRLPVHRRHAHRDLHVWREQLHVIHFNVAHRDAVRAPARRRALRRHRRAARAQGARSRCPPPHAQARRSPH